MMKNKKILTAVLIAAVICIILFKFFSGNGNVSDTADTDQPSGNETVNISDTQDVSDTSDTSGSEQGIVVVTGIGESFSLSDIPEYSGSSYVAVAGNVPFFKKEEITDESYEFYCDLDSLGRCGYAVACIGTGLMPTEKRESIYSVKPSGWQSVKYQNVEGESLYNRSHLIGYQLSGENANEKNLITGTRYMNAVGMLEFENIVCDYVKETGNHVMYRVTPIFKGDELIARGVLMEGLSVEDGGEGICFNVFCYNVQPDIEIDYSNGDSRQIITGKEEHFVMNTGNMKFHLPDCESAESMNEKNRQDYYGTREALTAQGYVPCGSCKP